MKIPTHYKTPRSKAEAKKRGAMYYITGKACIRGHESTRYTGSGKCIACVKENKDKHRKKPVRPMPSKATRQRIEKLKEKPDFEESW